MLKTYLYLQLAPDQGVPVLEPPSETKKKCEEDALELVKRTNTQSGSSKVGEASWVTSKGSFLCSDARVTVSLRFAAF